MTKWSKIPITIRAAIIGGIFLSFAAVFPIGFDIWKYSSVNIEIVDAAIIRVDERHALEVTIQNKSSMAVPLTSLNVRFSQIGLPLALIAQTRYELQAALVVTKEGYKLSGKLVRNSQASSEPTISYPVGVKNSIQDENSLKSCLKIDNIDFQEVACSHCSLFFSV